MIKNKYPKHNIDPKTKDDKFHLEYVKAAWEEDEQSPLKLGYRNRERYKVIDSLVIGNQSVDQYKKVSLGWEVKDESWASVDWKPRAVAAKLRDIWLAKIDQRGYNILATPIDPLAREERDDYYLEARAKIMLRDATAKVNPELAGSPMLAPNPGDPVELEELEMAEILGPQLKTAMEAEQGIELVFYNNDYAELRRLANEAVGDYGISAFADWTDENWKPRLRACDIKNLIISPCNKKDFSDARHIGEVIMEDVDTLPFDEETRLKIKESANNRRNTWEPGSWDKNKVEVLDLKFKTVDDKVYERRESRGNEKIGRASYQDQFSKKKTIIKGKEVSQFYKKEKEVVYGVKWIIGTDYVYECGPCNFQTVDKRNKAKCRLPFTLYAPIIKEGKTLSFMDRLEPLIHDYHNTIYKIQNFKAKWIPYIINLDLEAMENVALGAGGESMSEREILELIFTNFTALGRRMDATGQNVNYKMVEIEQTNMHQEYTALVNELARNFGEMRDFVGLNDLTDGSTPGERTLNYVASLGDQATNNALYPLIVTDKIQSERLAKASIERLVISVQHGDYEGTIPALGAGTSKFIRVTKNIMERIYDIKLEDKPTEAQKQQLLAEMGVKDSQGKLDPADIIMISETPNLKQAKVRLAHSLKKKEEANRQFELEKMKMNGQVQVESAQKAEEAKQKTLMLEYELKMKLLKEELRVKETIIDKQLKVAEDKTQADNITKIATKQMEVESAEATAKNSPPK